MTYPLRRLNLTKLTINIKRGARTSTILKASKEAGLAAKWKATPFAQKIAKQAVRKNLSDFERFSVMVNRKRRSYTLRQLAAVKKTGGKKK